MLNALDDNNFDVREFLVSCGFPRAARASGTSVTRLRRRFGELGPLLRSLPDLDDDTAAAAVNEHLTELHIRPSVVAHDGVGLHIHWSPSTATFDDQVIADIVMALAHEVCDSGTIRFGRCGASDCSDMFYDGTRNRSRRFCADPRCASKTHTADHRARRRRA